MIFSAFERMVASRYLRARRREGFISVIALFSLLGIMLGVATLIIVMSVMNGFRAELFQRVIGLNGHMNVMAYSGPMVGYDDIAAKNYSLSAGQYFEVKIEYSDLTPAQFARKLQGFTEKLDDLFKESAGLERDIKKQLAGLRHE